MLLKVAKSNLKAGRQGTSSLGGGAFRRIGLIKKRQTRLRITEVFLGPRKSQGRFKRTYSKYLEDLAGSKKH